MRFVSKSGGLAKYRKPFIRAEDYSGVHMNGEALSFSDKDIAEQLARAIPGIEVMKRQGLKPSCTEFALLMMGCIVEEYPTDPEAYHVNVDYGPKIGSEHTGSKMVGIFNDIDDDLGWHVLVPAHTEKGPLYVHKLTYGAVCFSGLADGNACL